MTEPVGEEQQHLNIVLSKIDDMLQRLRGRNPANHEERDVDEAQTAEEVAEEVVAGLRQEQIATLGGARKEPYFGRLDFQESGHPKAIELYIGKRGVEDASDGERLVIDWRAPVASMFYSFSGQDVATYESQGETIQGTVHLKRNIAIRDSRLQRVVDSFVLGQDNMNVTDEFLLYRLEEHKDNRLRDIVSTIQAEQDKIIRAKRNQAIFIQGVAGSGKTTVALHRLAYLLYQYSDQLRPERMVIFAPNEMFMDYISDVLPELGVGGVKQTTFANWALEQLNYSVKLKTPAKRLEQWFTQHGASADSGEFEVAKLKGSLQFLQQLDEALTGLGTDFAPQEGFEPWEGARLQQRQIAKWFYEEYVHYPLGKRRERVLARLKRWYESEYKWIRENDKSGKIKRQAASRFRTFKTRWPELTAVSLYQKLLEEVLPAGEEFEGQQITVGKSRRFRPEVNGEDLAPLLYLHIKLNGVDSKDSFQHVVIDEAQDFSPLQLAVLKEFCPSLSLTVLGDLAQSIHTYQGITNWKSFFELFPDEQRDFFQLNVSYRSTMEIIDFANKVLSQFPGFVPAEPVFRSGEEVVVQQVSKAKRVEEVIAQIGHLQTAVDTVAVVGPNEKVCTRLQRDLEKQGIESHLISSKDEQYSGGVSVIPVYLTKGLEFDAVLLVDVDAEYYQLTALDAKLLYVGCTRALHRLQLIYCGTPSPLLPVE